jgi:small subunit ribosomal protein S8
MELVSLPSKRIHMDAYGIRRLVSGKRSEFVKPLGMGEIAIIKVRGREKEWIEAREAVSLNVGGEVICRAR